MHKVPQRKSDISLIVSHFIGSQAPSMRRLRLEVIQPLEEIGEVAIVGGLVRDLVRYGPERRPISDIDLVIQGSPSAVAAIAKKMNAKQNRFGGYGVTSEQYRVDFWALSTTWARTSAGVHISKIEDILEGTFFNWDAIIYSTSKRKTYISNNYMRDLNSNFLEINLLETASAKGNFIRALRRLLAWQANPGPKLYQFLKEGVSQFSWDEIVKQERSAFYNYYLNQFSGFDEYMKNLERDGRVGFQPIQLSLFKDEELPSLPVALKTLWQNPLPIR